MGTITIEASTQLLTVGPGIELKPTALPLGSSFSLMTGSTPQPLRFGFSVRISLSNPLLFSATRKTSATYAVPTGYTFVDIGAFQQYNTAWYAVSNGGLTITSKPLTGLNLYEDVGCYGTTVINPGDKVMTSFELTAFNGATFETGFGLILNSPTPNNNSYLGENTISYGMFYNNSKPESYFNNKSAYSLDYGQDFEFSGAVVDILVDNTAFQMLWYRVNGGAWSYYK